MRIIFKTSYDADIRYFSNRVPALWYVALLLLATTLPFIINEFWLGEFTLMLIWAIAGMGLMLLVGHSGQASLGHAAFMAVGAYSNVILQEYLIGIMSPLETGKVCSVPNVHCHSHQANRRDHVRSWTITGVDYKRAHVAESSL